MPEVFLSCNTYFHSLQFQIKLPEKAFHYQNKTIRMILNFRCGYFRVLNKRKLTMKQTLLTAL